MLSHVYEQLLFSCLCSKVTVYSRKLQWFFFDSSITLSCDMYLQRLSCSCWPYTFGVQDCLQSWDRLDLIKKIMGNWEVSCVRLALWTFHISHDCWVTNDCKHSWCKIKTTYCRCSSHYSWKFDDYNCCGVRNYCTMFVWTLINLLKI